MPHPVIARLRLLLAPPVCGGDTVDWEAVKQKTLLQFPADYREFVESYGGGEIDEYLSVSTPPVPGSPYGDLLDRVDPALSQRDRQELSALLPGGDLPQLLPFTDSASGDVAFWLREGIPDTWRVAVFRRQTPYGVGRWTVFDGGMASFFLAVLTGDADPFSERIEADAQHMFAKWQGA
ncbi:SMI1/KNR4 family protein [Streptomyces sp. NPDC056323]|uniref:SMI1/KNR4 family protein n=1 Tax=unclassified Streptomyces TaxID=2593676 RepID=UPI0035DFCA61